MSLSFDWWGKNAHRGTSVVVKMENPNWSISEISSPTDNDEDDSGEAELLRYGMRKGGRGKNAKQITWVLLLKAHRAASCLSSLASATIGLASTVQRRVATGRTDSDAAALVRTRFYSFIKVFLCLSVLLLGFEVSAHLYGWHLGADVLQHLLAVPSSFGIRGFFESLYAEWLQLRAVYIGPLFPSRHRLPAFPRAHPVQKTFACSCRQGR